MPRKKSVLHGWQLKVAAIAVAAALWLRVELGPLPSGTGRFSRDVPVFVPVRGSIPAGFVLAGDLHADPRRVRVTGSGNALMQIDSIPLEAIDVTGVRVAGWHRAHVDIDALPGDLNVEPPYVDIFVPVVPATEQAVQ